METLLKLPYEIQITLAAGYIAYKIVTIGRAKDHRTEDFLLQVLAFGFTSRSITALLAGTRLPDFLETNTKNATAADIATIAFTTFFLAVVLGALWRRIGERFVRWVMNKAGVYSDDHESSVWQTIMHQNAKWTSVQLHLGNGKVLEAVFADMVPAPTYPITMNEDGIALYVTGVYDEQNNRTTYPITGTDNDLVLTYIPRSEIKRLDVAWRLPSSSVQSVNASEAVE